MPSKEKDPIIESLWVPSPGCRQVEEDRLVRRFETLTGIRLRSATVEAIPREFLGRTTNPPDEIAHRYCRQLQPRTYNALRRYGSSTGRARWTFGRLLEIRGFGLFSLLDLLEVLAKPGGECVARLGDGFPYGTG